jgi:hypothetical protein
LEEQRAVQDVRFGPGEDREGKYFPITTFRLLIAHTRLTLSFLSYQKLPFARKKFSPALSEIGALCDEIRETQCIVVNPLVTHTLSDFTKNQETQLRDVALPSMETALEKARRVLERVCRYAPRVSQIRPARCLPIVQQSFYSLTWPYKTDAFFSSSQGTWRWKAKPSPPS